MLGSFGLKKTNIINAFLDWGPKERKVWTKKEPRQLFFRLRTCYFCLAAKKTQSGSDSLRSLREGETRGSSFRWNPLGEEPKNYKTASTVRNETTMPLPHHPPNLWKTDHPKQRQQLAATMYMYVQFSHVKKHIGSMDSNNLSVEKMQATKQYVTSWSYAGNLDHSSCFLALHVAPRYMLSPCCSKACYKTTTKMQTSEPPQSRCQHLLVKSDRKDKSNSKAIKSPLLSFWRL